MSITAIAIAVGAFLAAIIGAYLKGNAAGASKQKAKQQDAEIKARHTADEVDNDVGAMPPDARREALRKWGPQK